MVWILALYTLAALNFTIAKAVLAYSQPMFFCAVRMLLASTILLPVIYLKNRGLPRINKTEYLDFMLIISVQAYLAFVLDLMALKHMSSSKGALFYNLSPFITALFSYLILKEKMTFKKFLGLCIGLLGFLPALLLPAPGEQLIQGSSYLSWPEVSMIGSVIASVFGWTIFRRLIKKGYDPLVINGIGMMGGWILSFASSLIFERHYWHPIPAEHLGRFIGLTILITFLANIIQYDLQGRLLKKYTATFLSFAGFITPLITALFAWTFLGETVSWTFFFSVLVIASGLALFYLEELRQGYITR